VLILPSISCLPCVGKDAVRLPVKTKPEIGFFVTGLPQEQDSVGDLFSDLSAQPFNQLVRRLVAVNIRRRVRWQPRCVAFVWFAACVAFVLFAGMCAGC